MPIILKHINTSDSDNIKLDDVNYNFDQLVANGGGPRGPQGSVGQSGPQGTTGWEGVQGAGTKGDQGYQGPAGSSSNSYWKKIDAEDGVIGTDYLIPISGNQVAPVINIGYINTDPEYSSKAALVGGKTPYQWLIHRKSYLYSNLRFLNSLISENAYDFKLEKSIGESPKDQMSMGFFDLTGSISTYTDSTNVYRSVQTSFRDSISSTDSLLIQSGQTDFLKPTIFNSPAAIKHLLRIENAGAGTDTVAVSDNNTGLVKFKTVQDLKGTVPFGTIVSILPSIFADNNKFINSQSWNLLDGATPLPIYAGKGVGIYDGWYLCNGKVWTDGDITHSVPMLGQFNYQIDDNLNSNSPLGQGAVDLTTNNKTHITGGSDIDMVATSVPTLVYNITSTVDTSSVTVGAGTGTTFKIKQLPQIIYLGRSDLHWSDAGTNQHPPVQLTFLLDDINATASKLNPDPYTLSVITDRADGNVYTFTSTVTAPSGYHWSTCPTPGDITGLPGYAAITDITLGPGVYPTTINVTIDIDPHPSVVTVATLNINTKDTIPFISPTFTNIELTRFNNINTTSTTPAVTTISYDFTTGKTFDLILNTNSGYLFSSNTAYIVSVSGGATYTVNSRVLSAGNTQLALNITITGVSVGVTALEYSIGLGIYSTIPRIGSNPTGYIIDESTYSNLVTKSVSVKNESLATVYIYVGIFNYSTGGPGSTGGIAASYTTSSTNLTVSTSINTTAYSGSSIALASGQIVTGTLARGITTDQAHRVQLFYSTVAGGSKEPLEP